VKWVLLIALWSEGRLVTQTEVYDDEIVCERIAMGVEEQANQQPDKQVLEIWCYPVRTDASAG
jgi:hypothetical protein